MKRDERRFLKEPDEFVVWTARAGEWARRHQGMLTGVAGALVFVVLVAGLLSWRSARQTDAASEAFRVARTKFAAREFQPAAIEFEAVTRDYPSTSFGRLAVLYRGHALLRSGDGPGATAAYQEFLARGEPDVYLRQLALTDLAYAQEQSGAAADARSTLAQAGELDGPYRIDALLGYARLSQAAGDTAAASEAYRKVLAENPDDETKTFVQRQLPADAKPAEG